MESLQEKPLRKGQALFKKCLAGNAMEHLSTREPNLNQSDKQNAANGDAQ